jgi:hypothetical protein
MLTSNTRKRKAALASRSTTNLGPAADHAKARLESLERLICTRISKFQNQLAAAALVTLSAGCNAGISLTFLKVRRTEFVG